jgi:hypothetical protein
VAAAHVAVCSATDYDPILLGLIGWLDAWPPTYGVNGRIRWQLRVA